MHLDAKVGFDRSEKASSEILKLACLTTTGGSLSSGTLKQGREFRREVHDRSLVSVCQIMSVSPFSSEGQGAGSMPEIALVITFEMSSSHCNCQCSPVLERLTSMFDAELPLQVDVQHLGLFHGVTEWRGANIPAAHDHVVRLHHRQDLRSNQAPISALKQRASPSRSPAGRVDSRF